MSSINIQIKFDVPTDHSNINQQVKNIVQNQIQNPKLNVLTIANKLKTSPRILDNQIRKEFRMSLSKYIKIQRLEKSRLLLLDNYPVSQVCRMVGFEEIASFSRAFKNTFGYVPSKLLRNKK